MNNYISIGTFALVFCGTGAIVINQQANGAVTAMFAGPICGASMNLARSISPAVVSGHIEHLWIYIVAPITGAAFAIPVFKTLHIKNTQNENSAVQ